MSETVEILLITGPAGVGKSTVCWEIGGRLAAERIAHAVIETDELDRVYPHPGADDLRRFGGAVEDVSAINLAAIWSTYRALGHTRLVMSGVMMHAEYDRRWITAAIPDAGITFFRLFASRETILERLDRRETGSGKNDQVARSLRQLDRMASQPSDGFVRIDTDGKGPDEIADIVLRRAGWM